MAVIQAPFGATWEGQAVDRFTLRSGPAEAEIITFGAALRTLLVPARSGELVDVVLGYDGVDGYQQGSGYLGAVVGRYANRIAGMGIQPRTVIGQTADKATLMLVIDGRRVALEANEGPKQLHGGPLGFSHRVFQARQSGESAVTLTYTAADGEGGFPGALTLHVTYTLSGANLTIRCEASSDKDTYCNITNHSYFNLNGGGDVMGHRLWLSAPQPLHPCGAGQHSHGDGPARGGHALRLHRREGAGPGRGRRRSAAALHRRL